MGIQIEPKQDYRLHLTGGIETVLDVPARGIEEGFSLAFSDGTLVRGTYVAGTDTCQFAIASEGAAMVHSCVRRQAKRSIWTGISTGSRSAAALRRCGPRP